MWISIGTALCLGVPLGFVLASRTDLGATGMWIANLVYASVNTILMLVRLRTSPYLSKPNAVPRA
jgi:Na+-driven multidrug efflux pump